MDNDMHIAHNGIIYTGLLERRKLEMFLAFATTSFGLFLLCPMISFKGLSTVYVLYLWDESRWGMLFALNGMSHILAIIVNGYRWWSPLIRTWSSAVTIILYGALAGSFIVYDYTSTAACTYAILVVGAFISWYWAVKDSITAVRLKRHASVN